MIKFNGYSTLAHLLHILYEIFLKPIIHQRVYSTAISEFNISAGNCTTINSVQLAYNLNL